MRNIFRYKESETSILNCIVVVKKINSSRITKKMTNYLDNLNPVYLLDKINTDVYALNVEYNSALRNQK